MSTWLTDKARLARGLSAADWLVLAEAWWTLPAYWLALRWVSYDRLGREPDGGKVDLPAVERLHRLVTWASRLQLLPMTCLVRACTLRRTAARRGLQAQVRIGAARNVEGIHAHAWVEVDGQVVGEDGVAGQFKVLKSSQV
ncbi:MAG: lasso peptide biosynthesis B2 protein [Chloroflexi bacterium]|nr:lasso peptide biosynthesis B2 protein [Chloroflexota bacterium]